MWTPTGRWGVLQSADIPDRNVELIQLISFAGSTWTLIWSSARCWNNCENDGREKSLRIYWQSSVTCWVYNIFKQEFKPVQAIPHHAMVFTSEIK